MDEEEAFAQNIASAHLGYLSFITHFTTLASTCMPPFVYVTDAGNPRLTSSVIDAIFHGASSIPGAPPTLFAHVNAVACFTPRVFYDTVLNVLAGWKPSWENGCQVWPGDDSQRYNDSIDNFLHGLRRLHHERTGDASKGKGKAAASENEQEPSMVIFIERAERLPENLPELIVPLSRLAELSRINASVILLSSVSWEDIRPALGASPDPYYLDVEPLAKQDVLQRLVSAFSCTSQMELCSDTRHVTYHPALQPLYERYVETLHNAISIYTNDPIELQYVAAARWPGFIKPVIGQYEELVRQAEEEGLEPPELEPPATDGRLRLFKFFLPTFINALDTLYPRLDNAADWAANNDYDASATSNGDGPLNRAKPVSSIKVDHLPRMSKFILIAAFVASTNPAKTDLRMFGRGPEERKKRRRKSGSPKKGGGTQTVVKASQRLLGPATFPLDRLLAILGALLEENDYETRPHDPRFELPGEYTDMETGRVHIYGAITELTLMRAMHRTSAVDRLDGPPMFKCGVSYDVALALARDLDVPLNDLLWDPA